MNVERLARALGWFSIVLGATEVLMPRALCRALGVREHRHMVRLFGLRELAAGIGILSATRQARRAGWLWGRVAGDALDLGALGAALAATSRPGRVAAALASVAGITALDVASAARMKRLDGSARGEQAG
ncbi:MAG TPA: hypothetical protein VG900_04615 [Hyphomicrobiaceae bacterium]|nr:hypothetical protein [Hyphomicrobiaceae bacterium]